MDTESINIRIFNSHFEFLGEVDNFTSLFYIRKWNTYGEFEFHVTKFDAELFKKGNIIMLNNDGSRAGIIEHIEISDDGKEDIKVKGYDLLYILFNRITIPPVGHAEHSFNTNIEDIMNNLIRANVTAPVDIDRQIANLFVEGSRGRGNIISFQTKYKNLGEEIVSLSKLSGLGITINLDYKNKKFIFKVLDGRDLRVSQRENPPAIFSVEYDNIKSQTYVDSNIDYKNFGYIVGQGEVTTTETRRTGLNRREVFINAKDISDGEDSINVRGNIKLGDTPQIHSIECEVDSIGYRYAWDLGDFVSTVSKRYGVKLENRVSEIKEIYEGGAVKIEPTLGEVRKTLTEKVKSSSNSSQESSQGTQGISGKNLEFIWNGTQLGTRQQGQTAYTYVDLKGTKGDQGIQGIQGIKGNTGAQGIQGIKGDTGTIGLQGIQGLKGELGIQGLAGKDGTQIIVQTTQPTLSMGGVWIQI